MTVQELKEKLNEFDDDTEIVLYLNCEEGMAELDDVNLVRHPTDDQDRDSEDLLPYVKGDYPWIVLDNKDKTFLMLEGT
jgi:hypothetical protein